ncbi:MAG: alpha/beta hydrolase fold domain-containing protein [Planctomycetaceae bacterium]
MIRHTLIISLIAVVIAATASDSFAQRRRAGEDRVTPTQADVKYGPHERNVFDLWLPEAAGKARAAAASKADGAEDKAAATRLPVYVWFHGGGFVGGDKSGFDPAPYLKAGMAVVSGNYRFVDGKETLSPVPLLDAARVVQTLRARADEWNLDTERIAVSGSSAGAVIALWIGYHDDLADPGSDDPVARQSTRVKCIAPLNGPTNLDPRWITKHMGGPPEIHRSFPLLFGASIPESDRPEVLARIKEMSAVEHVSADDPPTLLIYAGKLEGIPLPESASQGVLIHHAYFGKVLKESLDAAGVPNEFHPGTDPRQDNSAAIIAWLGDHLLPE